jgi:hypothetical protein
MSLEEYEIFLNHEEIASNSQLEATFPKFNKIVSDKGSEIPKSDLFCFMTEIQLQAILDNQVGQDGELDVDMTVTAEGEKISKFDIKTISLGDKVPSEMKKDFSPSVKNMSETPMFL